MKLSCEAVEEKLAEASFTPDIREHVANCRLCSELVRALDSMDQLIESSSRSIPGSSLMESTISQLSDEAGDGESVPPEVPKNWGMPLKTFLAGASISVMSVLLLAAQPGEHDAVVAAGLQFFRGRTAEMLEGAGLLGGLLVLLIPGPKKFLISGVLIGMATAHKAVWALLGHP